MRTSSTAAYWPVSPIRARTSPGSRGDVEPGHRGPAGVEPQQRGEDPHRRRLARAVGSEQAAHRARRHGQVEPVERARRAVPLAQSASASIANLGYTVRHSEYTIRSVENVDDQPRRLRPDQPRAPLGRREPASRGPKPGADGRADRRTRRSRSPTPKGSSAVSMRAVADAARRRHDVALPLRARQGRAARPDARPSTARMRPRRRTGNWRDALAWLARHSRALNQRHPWMLHIVDRPRPPLGPNILGRLRRLAAGGLRHRAHAGGDDRGDRARRAATCRARPAPTSRPRGERESGVSDEEWWGERQEFWEDYFDPERFPTISAVWDAGGYEEAARLLRVRPPADPGRDRSAARRPLTAEHRVRAPERDPLAGAPHPQLLEHVHRGDVGRLGERDHLVELQLLERDRRATGRPPRWRSRGPTTARRACSRARSRPPASGRALSRRSASRSSARSRPRTRSRGGADGRRSPPAAAA